MFLQYTQTLILVNVILVKCFDVLVTTRHHEGGQRCYYNRIIPLSVPDLPIPTRTLNSRVRLEFLNPKSLYNIGKA